MVFLIFILALSVALTFISIHVSHVGGGNLHGVEKNGSFLGFDAAVQHHFANVRDCRLDRDGVFEDGQVGVAGRAVVDVDRRFARYIVIVAKPFAVKSGEWQGSPFAFRWAQISWEYLSREEDIMIAPKAMIGRFMMAIGG